MKALLSLSSLLLVAACATAPVQVQTPKGTVTCQNYTDSMVLWDNAIKRPAGMTKKEADLHCRQQGLADQYKYQQKQIAAES